MKILLYKLLVGYLSKQFNWIGKLFQIKKGNTDPSTRDGRYILYANDSHGCNTRAVWG